jgi:hypothetical protein
MATLPRPTFLSARVSAAAAARQKVAPLVRAPAAARPVTARDLRRVAVAARRGRPPARTGPVTAADAGLALMARVGEHLAGDDTSGFLSFPATTLAAEPIGSFGLIHTVSLVPRHSAIWRPPPGLATLWDVWRTILDEAVIIDPDPDPAEQAALDSARQLIFDDVEAATPSTVYERYRLLLDQYLDAAEAAAEDGAAAGEGSPGATAPTEVEDAARRLAVEGRQQEVEAALGTIARFGMSKPSVMWNDARQAFEVLTSWKTDPQSGVEYPDTAFLPDSFERAAWTPIELDAAEITSLSSVAAERFPELVESHLFDDVIADDGGKLRVTALRAELSQFTVEQPWFRPNVLGLHSWRLRDAGAEPVSDGGRPATGRLPAFVTRIAVLRNLEIDRVRAIRAVVTRTPRTPGRPTRRVAGRSPDRAGRPTVRDHRTASAGPTVRDHRTQGGRERPTAPPVERPPAPVPQKPDPVLPYRQPEPRIAALACQLIPRCPDPDPALFPDPTMEATR